jgi:hypothetical protein
MPCSQTKKGTDLTLLYIKLEKPPNKGGFFREIAQRAYPAV